MILISTILVSCALCPWAPRSDLLPLATVWWGSFCGLLGVQFPSWPPFLCLVVCLRVLGLGRAFLAVGLSLVSCFVSSRVWLLFVVFLLCWCFCLRFCGCLFFGLCVPLLVWWGFFAFVLFLAVVGSPPRLLLPPSPLWLVPCGVLAQFLCWSLPLGIWLLLRRPGCLALMLGVWWCSVVLTSSCLMAAKAFGPVWGLYYPLHHVACVVAVLCTPTQRYSSADDPGPPLDTAKLHCCHSWQ